MKTLSDKIEYHKALKIRRLNYWKNELLKASILREPSGNWNLLQGKAQLPEKKVQRYFKARKKLHKKCKRRILECLKWLENCDTIDLREASNS